MYTCMCISIGLVNYITKTKSTSGVDLGFFEGGLSWTGT